jgi:hypothetical protein
VDDFIEYFKKVMDEARKCDGCAEHIKDAYKYQKSVEVDVTSVPPKPVDGMPHEPGEHDCPHGMTYYALPSINQVAQWAFRGIQ